VEDAEDADGNAVAEGAMDGVPGFVGLFEVFAVPSFFESLDEFHGFSVGGAGEELLFLVRSEREIDAAAGHGCGVRLIGNRILRTRTLIEIALRQDSQDLQDEGVAGGS
jgi:hypothetical protein